MKINVPGTNNNEIRFTTNLIFVRFFGFRGSLFSNLNSAVAQIKTRSIRLSTLCLGKTGYIIMAVGLSMLKCCSLIKLHCQWDIYTVFCALWNHQIQVIIEQRVSGIRFSLFFYTTSCMLLSYNEIYFQHSIHIPAYNYYFNHMFPLSYW